MQKIELGCGYFTVVDDEDFGWLSRRRWYLHKTPNPGIMYVKAWKSGKCGVGRIILMHREIMGLSPDDEITVDHVDGHGLNNTRANLRLATQLQQMRNRRPNRPHRGSHARYSRFKGVSWDPSGRNGTGKPWRAGIRVEGKRLNLGRFWKQGAAAEAYDAAAQEHFGEFAVLNFPQAA